MEHLLLKEDKDAAIAALKNVKGVRDVMDMATSRSSSFCSRNCICSCSRSSTKVTDAVKDFPAVKVDVVNGELTLTGEVTGRAS